MLPPPQALLQPSPADTAQGPAFLALVSSVTSELAVDMDNLPKSSFTKASHDDDRVQ